MASYHYSVDEHGQTWISLQEHERLVHTAVQAALQEAGKPVIEQPNPNAYQSALFPPEVARGVRHDKHC